MKSRPFGLTLVELLVVLSIVSILMAFAVPSMVDMTQRSHLQRYTSALNESIQQARTAAINGGDSVSLCASSDGVHCDSTWSGWIVFQGTPPASTVAAPNVIAAHSISNVQVTAPAAVTFDGLGAANSSFLARLCDSADSAARALHVSALGRVRLSGDADKDGIHESPATGADLSCS